MKGLGKQVKVFGADGKFKGGFVSISDAARSVRRDRAVVRTWLSKGRDTDGNMWRYV